MKHPVTGARYEATDEGLVRVTDAGGDEGLFHPDGTWHSGELRYADPHLCDYVGGRHPGDPAPV